MKTEKQIEGQKKQSAFWKNRWQDPEYRKKVIERQRALGLRSYGSHFTQKEPLPIE